MPELNFEKIAALRPDLILGMYSGIFIGMICGGHVRLLIG